MASVEQQRSESPASTMNQDMSSKDMTSKDGIVTKVMSKGAGKGGWLKAPLSEAHEPHGELIPSSKNLFKKKKTKLL